MKISYQTARTAPPQLSSNDSYNERQKWTTTIKGEFLILRVLCIFAILHTRRHSYKCLSDMSRGKNRTFTWFGAWSK